jgi:transmembrane sensor
MRLDENNPQHIQLIAGYLSGEMDEAEQTEFEKQFFVSAENKFLVNEMKEQWNLLHNYADNKTPDTRKAWNKLFTRLEAEQLIPDNAPVKLNYTAKLMRAAAIALLLIAAGSIVYFGLNQKPEAEMVLMQTGNEGNTLIKTLTDGSVIYLAQNSSFSFPGNFNQKSRNVELSGEAFFDIAPDPGKPFIIETEKAFIEVLGTAFNVKTTNGSNFELIVDRGKVKVTPKSDPLRQQLVVAGEKISSTGNNFIKSKRTSADKLMWYTKRMQFKDETLENIISVLNRNFDAIFVIAGSETGKRRLTVTFNNDSVSTMSELICLTLNLKSQTKNDSILLLDNKKDSSGN